MIFLLILSVLASVLLLYHVVTEIAEQIICRRNYRYNRGLEASGAGVSTGNSVFGQNEKFRPGYSCGRYRFGFTFLEDVGCEAVAAYNLMIALGRPEPLSQTVFDFEKKAIEYAVAFGRFGSDPLAMTRYFRARKLKYSKFTSFEKFEKAVAEDPDCFIIMSQWNHPWYKNGIHTFFIDKNSGEERRFKGFNFSYRFPGATDKYSELSAFNDGDGFVVGYVFPKNK